MILKLSDNYICDNSLECEKNCYFVLTKSNEKFLADAKAKGAQIITPAKAYELAQIPKDLKIIGITGTNGKTISMGIGTVEHIEDDSFVCVFFLKIALHHRQFIQVSE